MWHPQNHNQQYNAKLTIKFIIMQYVYFETLLAIPKRNMSIQKYYKLEWWLIGNIEKFEHFTSNIPMHLFLNKLSFNVF